MLAIATGRVAVAVAVAVVISLPAAAAAQNSASASATADVQQPITVTKTRDLAFGTVYPGVNKSIAVTDGTSASFSIAGQASAGVTLSFTLPATLASGGNTLPLATWVARRNTSNSSASGTDFTPSSSATAATLHTDGNLYVFVGATAQPAAGQAAGSYSGTLTMTVVYP